MSYSLNKSRIQYNGIDDGLLESNEMMSIDYKSIVVRLNLNEISARIDSVSIDGRQNEPLILKGETLAGLKRKIRVNLIMNYSVIFDDEVRR